MIFFHVSWRSCVECVWMWKKFKIEETIKNFIHFCFIPYLFIELHHEECFYAEKVWFSLELPVFFKDFTWKFFRNGRSERKLCSKIFRHKCQNTSDSCYLDEVWGPEKKKRKMCWKKPKTLRFRSHFWIVGWLRLIPFSHFLNLKNEIDVWIVGIWVCPNYYFVSGPPTYRFKLQ